MDLFQSLVVGLILFGIIVGALFIAIVAPMVVDFNDDKDEEETISVDDIEIVIE